MGIAMAALLNNFGHCTRGRQPPTTADEQRAAAELPGADLPPIKSSELVIIHQPDASTAYAVKAEESEGDEGEPKEGEEGQAGSSSDSSAADRGGSGHGSGDAAGDGGSARCGCWGGRGGRGGDGEGGGPTQLHPPHTRRVAARASSQPAAGPAAA
ncbi:hypothetical protein C2E20_6337 [Micractinium conductrix]|uniref:Uncharacterized protein n=1 Tax=Micractinium conductrix TaxID=554055 RepID=A0A2P6V848_9CHLO|nr:hypothetical protein C2E20_6337 [Micractinium conductrix]|eukprot:PSC70262.1 hypothetical protein C2E20_6337 [Micractinium conductrix]